MSSAIQIAALPAPATQAPSMNTDSDSGNAFIEALASLLPPSTGDSEAPILSHSSHAPAEGPKTTGGFDSEPIQPKEKEDDNSADKAVLVPVPQPSTPQTVDAIESEAPIKPEMPQLDSINKRSERMETAGTKATSTECDTTDIHPGEPEVATRPHDSMPAPVNGQEIPLRIPFSATLSSGDAFSATPSAEPLGKQATPATISAESEGDPAQPVPLQVAVSAVAPLRSGDPDKATAGMQTQVRDAQIAEPTKSERRANPAKRKESHELEPGRSVDARHTSEAITNGVNNRVDHAASPHGTAMEHGEDSSRAGASVANTHSVPLQPTSHHGQESARAADHTSLPGFTADGSSEHLRTSFVQSSTILQKSDGAEMRVAIHTSELGHVEIRTVMHDNSLGASIGVERPEVRHVFEMEAPDLQKKLAEHSVELRGISLLDTGSHPQRESSGNSGQSQYGPAPSHRRGESPAAETHIEPHPAVLVAAHGAALNLLA